MSKEDNGEATGGSSWWGSFIKSAKEKSLSAMEVIKSDLAEFTSTMSTDAASLINEASSQLNSEQNQTTSASIFKTITKSISELTENFNLNSFENDTTHKEMIKSSSTLTSTSIHDRLKKDLESLQLNEQNYLNDPQDDNYAQWEQTFNPDNFKTSISDLLIENSAMRLLYSQLVPAQISNIQFWSRYFYRVNQLEEEHKKRVKLIEKATIDAEKEQKENDWDDDDEPIENQEETSQIETNEIQNNVECKVEEILAEEKLEVSQPKEEDDDDKKDKQSLTQSISKTEDSDEWEKVSNLVVSEIEDKTDFEEDDANKTQTNNSDESGIKEEEDLTKKRENLLTKLEKIDGTSAKDDAEWDEWE